ncbi:MAG: NADH-quinone oxidoreductase subunit M [Chitinophagaceae bacterium]|nr:NADH-quinone oxidoreductase subunit M [Chitinophagaceae bacterium]
MIGLSTLLFVPLLTALLVAIARSDRQVKLLSVFGAVVQLALVLYLFNAYSAIRETGDQHQWLFEEQYKLFPSLGISYHLGVDGIAISMLILTALVVLSGLLISWKQQVMVKEYYLLLILLSLGAYGFFMSLDLLLLFFFLEIAVIPKYLLIGIWGSGKKSYSANKLALMLMAGSALVLIGILGLYFAGGRTFDLTSLANAEIIGRKQLIFFPFIFIGFGVFTALFPFHTWVPDGHSSAPTAGSMFLAGISMKLGGYGCLRVAIWLMPEAAREYSTAIIILASIGILYGAFVTLMQKDLKYMNAYSSISHCGFVLLALGMLTKTAVVGAVMQMVSHGLMTALFFAVIGIIYERTHTRQMNEMGGLLKPMPFTVALLFIAGLCSLGLPGFSGFVAEMTIFVGAWQRDEVFYHTATVLACASIVVTAVYILRAIGKTAMGPTPAQFSEIGDANWTEKIAVLILVAGILAMGLMPNWLTTLIGPDAELIIQKINNSR